MNVPPSPPPPDFPWTDLGRWLAGEMSLDEAARFEFWVQSDVERAAFVSGVRQAWDLAGAAGEGWDAQRALRRIRAAQHTPVIALMRRHPEPSSRASRVMRIGLAAAATIVAVLAARTVILHERAPAAVAMTEYRAARGQRVILRLSDGTQVTLAPGTVLRRPADFGRRERRLELEGEGYFVVTHDAARPFTVQTARLIARDLGTRFSVRAYADDPTADLVVAEGTVAVDSFVLGAGEGGGATRNGSFARTTISLEQALAWTDGRLVFLDTPLAEVASRLARWYDVEVTLASPGLGALRVTGSFRDEPANAVLDAIARSLGLRLVRGESGYQLTRG